MKTLTQLSREELIKRYRTDISNYKRKERHSINRLKKIRNSIDYLLKHPFSDDVGNRTVKHKRDVKHAPMPVRDS